MSEQEPVRVDQVKASVAIMAYVIVWTFGTLFLVSWGLPGWAGAALLGLMFAPPMILPDKTNEVLYG